MALSDLTVIWNWHKHIHADIETNKVQQSDVWLHVYKPMSISYVKVFNKLIFHSLKLIKQKSRIYFQMNARYVIMRNSLLSWQLRYSFFLFWQYTPLEKKTSYWMEGQSCQSNLNFESNIISAEWGRRNKGKDRISLGDPVMRPYAAGREGKAQDLSILGCKGGKSWKQVRYRDVSTSKKKFVFQCFSASSFLKLL